ncbi:hypothetical protein ALI22I_20550 [Saccharothrix sp. ALI-22-I]|nr:hypothetical protein ALI22I_20550 [Saccharothrix sp. ALI-22-I]
MMTCGLTAARRSGLWPAESTKTRVAEQVGRLVEFTRPGSRDTEGTLVRLSVPGQETRTKVLVMCAGCVPEVDSGRTEPDMIGEVPTST